MSIFQLNMAFAQLMTMPVALLGQWLTLQVLFPWLAVMTLAMVSLILVTQRQIIRSQIQGWKRLFERPLAQIFFLMPES